MDLLQAFYLAFLYKFQLRETSKIIRKMPKWLSGLAENEIAGFTNKIFEEILVHAIRPQMKDAIEEHRRQNARLVMLSAAFNYICTPVAEYLKMDDILCSRLQVVDGHFTGKTIGDLCFDEVKLARVKEFCTKNSFKLEDAWYYADSMADLAVFNAVGSPVCINPDKKLAKLAVKKKWPVFNW
jgi:HAD superfamily hydrolase (TIGR01490 family)